MIRSIVRRFDRRQLAAIVLMAAVVLAATAVSGLLRSDASAAIAPADTFLRVNAGGPAISVSDGGPNWAADTTYLASAQTNTYSTNGAISLAHPSVSAQTPQALFQTERWSPAPQMIYEFPVSSGQNYDVDLYLAEIWATANGIRSFSVEIEGQTVLSNYDIHAAVGHDAGIVLTLTTPTVADDSLTIEFVANVQNPKVSAIAIGAATGAPPAPLPTSTPTPPNPGGAVSFGSSGLAGENLNNPTSLDFGPDGRLYVVQQNSTILAYTVTRNGANDYSVTGTETINLVKNDTLNHNDDGSVNNTNQRQSTGLLTAGTASNPVLYVSSSDWRIGGGGSGNDANLDTNSGVISRLTWTGSSWDKVDLVRGLPRSEENHSTNGMVIDPTTNTMYVMSGGHANKGAPSNNFSGTSEYYLSAALLSVDLDAIDALPVQNDGTTKYVYDLPTLDDPTRGIPGQPDPGDPFGGNNGLNQAIPEPGGPVQVYSPGYRNAFDVTLTEAGNLYTFDNGPNTGWGGLPITGSGNTCTNEFNESGSNGHGDTLHFISGPGYYGGHPTPIRAFPETAGVYVYEKSGSNWNATAVESFGALLPGPLSLADFPANPVECEYSADDPSKYLAIINSSTNGITEYTASNFGGALQGDILAAAFNGTIYRFGLTADGSDVTAQESLFSGFGQTPLDVIAQGDGDIFPGSVWAATYGSNSITIFEPQDFGTGGCTGADNPALDEDGDGYTNADEIDNGTNPCSGGSAPADNDNDNVSDLNDADDDNDGIADVNDPFAIDAANGLTTTIPVARPFNNSAGGFFGLGLTGLMTNGTTDYLDQFDEGQLDAGGATEKLGINGIGAGDSFQGNTQQNAFQYGVNATQSTAPFVVRSTLQAPFFDGQTPSNFQSAGIQVGLGDQDNYLKLVMTANGGAGGVEMLLEDNAVASQALYGSADYNADILAAVEVELSLLVNPGALTMQPGVSIDGQPVVALGAPLPVPASWFDTSDGVGMAVGVISTSFGSSTPFNAVWDNLDIDTASVVAPMPTPTPAAPTPTPVVPTPTPVPPTPGGPFVVASGLSGSAGSEQFFVIDVPAGASSLSVDLAGLGDADLYLHPGSQPTTGTWTCRPYLDATSNESCVIDNPVAGQWFVMVRGWASFSQTSVTANIN